MTTNHTPTDPRETAARAWGKTNGYSGRVGGWIYNAHGRPVAQGWMGIYFKYRRAIDAWAELTIDDQLDYLHEKAVIARAALAK